MLNVKEQNHVLRHVMTLRLFGTLQSYSLEKPQKDAQLTQLWKLSWVKEKSCEKSREMQGFLFD